MKYQVQVPIGIPKTFDIAGKVAEKISQVFGYTYKPKNLWTDKCQSTAGFLESKFSFLFFFKLCTLSTLNLCRLT